MTHILLDLHEDGFLLRFEPASQRLVAIEIYDASKLDIAYNTNVFWCGARFFRLDRPTSRALAARPTDETRRAAQFDRLPTDV